MQIAWQSLPSKDECLCAAALRHASYAVARSGRQGALRRLKCCLLQYSADHGNQHRLTFLDKVRLQTGNGACCRAVIRRVPATPSLGLHSGRKCGFFFAFGRKLYFDLLAYSKAACLECCDSKRKRV